jgi:hypothetical protein
MKIEKLYTLRIRPDDVNQAFVKSVLVDEDAITFFNIHKDYHTGVDEDYRYIGGLKDTSARRRTNPAFNIAKFDKNNLQDATFYRTPKLALPQVKLQLLKDKYNVKVVRDKEKADYIITSDKYFESLTEYNWNNYYSGLDIKELYLPKIKGHVSEFIYDKICHFVDHVINENGFIFIDNRLPYGFDSTIRAAFGDRHDKLKDKGQEFWLVTDSEALTYLTNNPDKLVKDSDLINYCNEDSIVLTPEECKSISQMIKSGDRDTIALALEMMANCNIEKSFDKLALIFAFYKDELGNARNWNSVNVKSLKKQLVDVPHVEGNNGFGFNLLVRALHAKGCLTPFAVGAISNKMCKTILSYVGLTSSESVFDIKPKDLKLKSEYTEDLPF